ncbi:hypothetical protein [Streptomyces sp. NPDC003006]
MRRRSQYVGVLVAPLLLGAVACGAGSGDGEERAGDAKGSGAPQREKGRGEDRAAPLKAMELTGDDIGPRRKIRALNNGLAAAYGKSETSADPVRCRPVDQMLSYSSSPKPKAFHPYSVIEKGSTYDEPKGKELVIGIAAHDEAGAKKVLAGLRTAVAKCGKGFESVEGTYNEVRRRPDGGLGDEAVSYVVYGGIHGEDASARFTVVRSGSTVVTFRAENQEAPWEATDPDNALVKAQLAKVARVAKVAKAEAKA